jgi:hypothetical protein
MLNTDKLIPSLCGACNVVRSMCYISKVDTIKSVYFAYFHSIMKYGIILRGTTHLIAKTFILQKTIVRIMAGVKTINSFKSLLKRLEILTLSREPYFH